MRRIFNASIWAHGAIPDRERKYAGPLKRVALPAFDFILIIGGFYAVSRGIPAVDELLPPIVADSIGYAFAASAFFAFIGLAFPRLYALEIGAKWIMFGLLGVYLISLRVLADVTDSGTRDFISAIVAALMIVPLYRLWILGVEVRDRRELRTTIRGGKN